MRKYFTLLALALVTLVSCDKDDPIPEPPVPPVLGDIVATYNHNTLKLMVDGEPSSTNASVTVVKEQDNTMTLHLRNVVPGVPVFLLPKSTFEVVTRSMYASKISGFAVDSIAGYEVKVDGTVIDSVLTAAVTLREIGGVVTNVKGFYSKTYKGDMTIGASGVPDVVSMQRIYTSPPTGRDTSSVKLQIHNFTFSGANLGTITLDTIKVLKRGSIYAFKASGRKLQLPGIGDVTVDVNGSMVDLNMNLSLVVNATPIVAGVVFGGQQVTESTDTKATITLASDVVYEQPVMKDSNYTFSVWNSTEAAKLLLTPKVELAKGAVVDSVVIDYGDERPIVKIDTEMAIDFSKFAAASCVKYYVVAEDVRKTSVKSLFMQRLGFSVLYTMENWVTDAGNQKPTPAGLTNSNMATTFLNGYNVDLGGHLPVERGSDGSAEIRTFRSVSPTKPQTLLPGVIAGALFNGSFALNVENTLMSTHFGEIYEGEPKTFKFTYK